MMAQQRLRQLLKALGKGRAHGPSREGSVSCPGQARRRHRSRVILICLALAFAIDLLTFDLPTLSTLGRTARQLTVSSTSYDPDTGAQTWQVDGIDDSVDDIMLQVGEQAYGVGMQGVDSPESLRFTVSVTDEGNALPVSVGGLTTSRSRPDGTWSKIATYGRVSSLTITSEPRVVTKDDVGTGIARALVLPEIVNVKVCVNGAIPLDGMATTFRSLVLFVTLLGCWALRPRSGLYAMNLKLSHSLSMRLWLGLMLALTMIFAVAGLPRSLIREPPFYDSHHAIASYHEYFELAQALSKGEVSLDIEPSKELLELSNPYDHDVRDARHIDFYWDHALYKGRYYVYFGILPCLLFHLPFYLLTGGEFPTWLSVYISLAAAAAGLVYLLNSIVRRWFGPVSAGGYLVALSTLFLGSWMLLLAAATITYFLPIAVGLALAVWALGLWVTSTAQGTICVRRAALGAFLAALTLLSRPQFVVVALLGAALLVDAIRRDRRNLSPRLGLVFVPVAVVCLAFFLYNFLRFGNILDVGVNYNLTTNDVTHRGFSLERTLVALWWYLLQPATFGLSDSLIQGATPTLPFLGRIISEKMPGGVLTTTPLLLAPLLLAPLYGGRARRRPLLTAMLVLSLASGVLLAAFNGEAGGVLPRYFLDFGIFLSVAAIIPMLSIDSGSRKGEIAPEAVAQARFLSMLAFGPSVLVQSLWLLFVF